MAAVSAPSPSNRRNRLGNVNAVTKADARPVAPNTAVTKISRTKPKHRDKTVATETMLMFFRLRDTARFSPGLAKVTSYKSLR